MIYSSNSSFQIIQSFDVQYSGLRCPQTSYDTERLDNYSLSIRYANVADKRKYLQEKERQSLPMKAEERAGHP